MKFMDFLKMNEVAKTHTWKHKGVERTFMYSGGRDVFNGMYYVNILGGEFPNEYGQGDTEEGALASLKLRLIQLKNK